MRTQAICLALAVVLICPIASAQWTQVHWGGDTKLDNRSVRHIAVGNNSIIAVTNDSGSVYVGTNGLSGWELAFPKGGRKAAISPSGTAFVLHLGQNEPYESLFRSTDNGLSWSVITSITSVGDYYGLTNIEVTPLGIVLGAATECHNAAFCTCELIRSTDDGLSWTQPMVNGNGYVVAGSIAFGDAGLVVTFGGFGRGTNPSMVMISYDSGETWLEHDSAGGAFTTLAAVARNGALFGGDAGGLYYSNDSGTTCKPLSAILVPEDFSALPSGQMLVGTNGRGVFLFSASGDSLGPLNQGLTDLHIHTLDMDAVGYVYAGTDSGVFKRPLSELVSVNSTAREVPREFILGHNYPNPFNPSTTIEYELPTQSHVNLKVFNMLGQEVAVLLNEVQTAGYKSVEFNGSSLPSGVYLYRLQAGEFVAARKLVLLK